MKILKQIARAMHDGSFVWPIIGFISIISSSLIDNALIEFVLLGIYLFCTGIFLLYMLRQHKSLMRYLDHSQLKSVMALDCVQYLSEDRSPSRLQSLYCKLFGKVYIQLFTGNFSDGAFMTGSRCKFTITKKEFFQLKLRDQLNIENQEVAIEVLRELKAEKGLQLLLENKDFDFDI